MNNIYNILSKSYDLNECNIEIRDKGIIIYFKSKQSTYLILLDCFNNTAE